MLYQLSYRDRVPATGGVTPERAAKLTIVLFPANYPVASLPEGSAPIAGCRSKGLFRSKR